MCKAALAPAVPPGVRILARDAMFTYEYEYFRVAKELTGSMRMGASDCHVGRSGPCYAANCVGI
jgi:hypothetical protein